MPGEGTLPRHDESGQGSYRARLYPVPARQDLDARRSWPPGRCARRWPIHLGKCREARAYFAAVRLPMLAIDGGLHIEGLPAEKQPGAFVRRIYGHDQDATDEEVLDYYARELENIGGENIGLWEGAHALVVSDDQVFVDKSSFKTILTSRRKGDVVPGAPLDALTIDPATGRYYSEMAWSERPDVRWLSEFLKQHLDAL